MYCMCVYLWVGLSVCMCMREKEIECVIEVYVIHYSLVKSSRLYKIEKP